MQKLPAHPTIPLTTLFGNPNPPTLTTRATFSLFFAFLLPFLYSHYAIHPSFPHKPRINTVKMSANDRTNGSQNSQKVAKSVIHLGPKPDQVLSAYFPVLLEPVRTVSYGPQGSKWANASAGSSGLSARSSSSSLASSNYSPSYSRTYGGASAGDRSSFAGHNGFAFKPNKERARAAAEAYVAAFGASKIGGVKQTEIKRGGARASQVGWIGKDDSDSDFVKNFYAEDKKSGGTAFGNGSAAGGVGAGGYNGGNGNDDDEVL